VLGSPSREVVIGLDAGDPLEDLRRELSSTARSRGDGADTSAGDYQPPFVGGWVIALSYDLGAVLEPTTRHGSSSSCDGRACPRRAKAPSWPAGIVMYRLDAAIVGRHESPASVRWMGVGDGTRAPRLLSTPMLARAAAMEFDEALLARTQKRYVASVHRCVEYIRAGDVFQANLTHQLRGTFNGSARALFRRMLKGARPWYGAYLELESGLARRAALCASPELFLQFDARTRRIETRPIKGTRPLDADPRELRESAKDQAELNMIIDLMRNDLGRVARVGSVEVEAARELEAHASVRHAVASISAEVRDGLDVVDVLRATMPGGSITGAPKVRAMQIINELEHEPRGLYTGAIGFVSDAGDITFNIAIRTLLLNEHRAGASARTPFDEFSQASARFGVGAGIVADSDAESEWRETLDKAGVFRALCTPANKHTKPRPSP
jgi:para-aminobenzoate synthetase component I